MGITDQQKVLEGTVQLVHCLWSEKYFSSFCIGNHLFPHRGSIKFQVLKTGILVDASTGPASTEEGFTAPS